MQVPEQPTILDVVALLAGLPAHRLARGQVGTVVEGRKIATPLDWYPRLKQASGDQRANFELMPMGIHWPDLDEDLGIIGMLKGRRS